MIAQRKKAPNFVLSFNQKKFLTMNAKAQSILSYLGPDIIVKMRPIGRVEVSYESVFESAGINQTRLKIYMNVKSTMQIILPFESRDLEVVNNVPVCVTIIVGEIPRTILGSDVLSNK